jgi:GntR family transcriptional regulator, transcriptional repressor for pyruvate dehydrogenase complex
VTQRVKLADRLYGTLRQLVDTGEWPVGTRMPPEIELAQAHGVSRPVVREALIRLRADGIIGSRQGAGNFVITGGVTDAAGYRPIENVADLIEAFEFRFSVECDIAALAAIRHTRQELELIQEAAEAVNLPVGNDGFGDADFEFHFALAQASRNAMYWTTLNMLRNQIVFGMRLVGEFSPPRTAPRVETVLDEHRAIVDAISVRDASGANAAMGRHLTNSRRRILGFEIATDWQRAAVIGASERRQEA